MLVKINRSWLRAAAVLVAMLGISSAAWADSFMYAEENDDYTGWTNYQTASCSGGTCTATITVTPNRTIYVGYATGTTSSTLYKGSISLSQTGLYWIQDQEKKGYHFAKFSTSATSITVSYNTSTHAYTIAAGAPPTYDVATNATGCTVYPTSYSSVTAGSSVTFTVTPTSGYTYVNATYSGGTSGSISKSDNTFTFTPTGSGTFNVTYALQYTVTPSISGGTVSPSTPQTVASGSTVSFTVTPESGYTYSSATYSGTKTSLTRDGNVITLAPTSSGTLSIVYVGQSAPQVRIGEKPRFDAECGLTVGAYVAQRGCNNITNFTLYYSNIASFRSDADYKTGSKEVAVSNPAINTNTNITLSATEVEEVVSPGEILYLRVKGTNAQGSALSDVVPVKYECNRFVKRDLDVDFRACPGEHQFAWSDMFLSPEPTTWSVTKGGNDAKADFTLVNGQMIWNTTGKTETSYTYVFTAKKDGYADGTATLNITYDVPGSLSTGSITSLTAGADEATPYENVSLTAAGTTGDITQIEWTTSPATASIIDASGNTLPATATFKADKVSSTMTYTVKVTGYRAGVSEDCASASATTTITVKPDKTEDCD